MTTGKIQGGQTDRNASMTARSLSACKRHQTLQSERLAAQGEGR